METLRSILRPALYVWALPATLIGLAVALICGASDWRWKWGALECTVKRTIPPWAVAQTFGFVILYRPAVPWARVRMHERGHVRQCLVLGPLVLLAYPLASLVAWASGDHYYEANYFERNADAYAATPINYSDQADHRLP